MGVRRNKSLPKFIMFLQKVEAKQETEKVIASKNKKLQDFWKRWEPLLLRYLHISSFQTRCSLFSVILRGESLWLAHLKSALLIFVI